MQELINSTSYITLHFDQMTSNGIEYDIDEESAFDETKPTEIGIPSHFKTLVFISNPMVYKSKNVSNPSSF